MLLKMRILNKKVNGSVVENIIRYSIIENKNVFSPDVTKKLTF